MKFSSSSAKPTIPYYGDQATIDLYLLHIKDKEAKAWIKRVVRRIA